MKDFKIAVCQVMPTEDKARNIKRTKEMIDEAGKNNASLIVLGEMFNCPYENEFFPKFAEPVPDGETCQTLSQAAKENRVYIVGGSIPEQDEDKIYNTSCIFNPHGEIIGSHRKMHLFDVELESGLTFKESDTLGKGNQVTVV